MQNYLIFILVALGVLNVRTYILMIIDKRRAVKGKWRISERQLFISGLLLGSIGIWLGLLPPVNHKKSKTSFVLKLLGITILQIGVGYWLVEWLIEIKLQ